MGVESNTSASYKMVLLQIYPVGSIYESVIYNDPNEFIGGTWVRLGNGRIFIGASGVLTSEVGSHSDNLTVEFNESQWVANVPNLHVGTYEFIYDGLWWTNQELGNELDLSDYGIHESGHLQENNFINIVVTSPSIEHGEYPLGAEGGEATHTLTLDEIPSHRHTVGLDSFTYNSGVNRKDTLALDYEVGGKSIELASSGRSVPHENMPPYVVYYAWERIS